MFNLFYKLDMDKETKKTEFMAVRVAPELRRALMGLRKLEDDSPSESEMVRRLIQRAADKAMEE